MTDFALHFDRVAQSFAGPSFGRDWTVCRFVQRSNGTTYPGWPLRGSPAFGWSDKEPVAFFTEEEATRRAEEENARHKPGYIAHDVPVHVSAIRWRVRLYSHYDGSEIVGETDDYAEAIRGFTAACGVAARENTPTVGYLNPELHGETPVPAGARLPESFGPVAALERATK
jgi:hypothetical protein